LKERYQGGDGSRKEIESISLGGELIQETGDRVGPIEGKGPG